LFWVAVAAAAGAVIVYGLGLWRRWRPGPDGRPVWASDPNRFREPWTAAAFALVLAAIVLLAVARVV